MNEIHDRILNLNPSVFYKRINGKFDRFNRRPQIGLGILFPAKNDGKCDCGCGEKLTGRKRRWANEECSIFAHRVYRIFNGDSEAISFYFEDKCCSCGRTGKQVYSDDIENLPEKNMRKWRNPLQVDHKLAVMNGGSGMWLENYQMMCEKCHRIKTKKDFKQTSSKA